MDVYLHQNDERTGPHSLKHIQGRLDLGELSGSDAVWFEGCSDWVTMQDVPGIMLPGGDHLVDVATVPPFDAYQGDEPYVFVSYAHKDAAVVYEEIMRLHEAGCNLWYDEGIEASNEWPEEIAQAVVGCAVFLVFISSRATASVNCRNEINMALNKRKPFLAIHLEETELPLGLELRMGDLQAVLRYKLPADRYQRKAQDAIDQLLGKKPKKKKTAFLVTQSSEATHEIEPVVKSAQSKVRRKGLVFALLSVVLIACGVGGFQFFGNLAEETPNTATEGEGLPDAAENTSSALAGSGKPDETVVNGPRWDFVYGYKHVNEAQTYLLSKSGMKKYSEWQVPPQTYWGPNANDVKCHLVYKFPLAGIADQVHLKASASCWDFYTNPGGQGRGVARLQVSPDGTNWTTVKDSIGPPLAWGSGWKQNGLVPVGGSNELWVRMTFFVQGSPNASYTVAQTGHSDVKATRNVFEIKVRYASDEQSKESTPGKP